MKNIFNKLGYMSKPALIGTVLGVATVAVGIGIVTNFGGGPKGSVAGPALEQYSSERASSANLTAGYAPGYSKEDLEASMALAEQQRSVNSVEALRSASAKDRAAFALNGEEAEGYGMQAGAYDENGNALQGSGIDGMAAGASGVDAVAAGAVAPNEQSAKNKAADAKKAAQQRATIDRAGATLVSSKGKLGIGSGGSGSGSSSGGSYGGYALPTAPEGAAAQNIPQNLAGQLVGNTPDIDSHKMGRAGSMGGFGVKAGRGDSTGSGQQFYSTGIAELSNASRFSQLGKKTVYGDSAKGAAFAEAAFDGSQTGDGVQIGEGANIAQAAGSALERSANPNLKNGINKVGKLGDTINNDIQEAEELRGKISTMMSMMFLLATTTMFLAAAAGKTGGWGILAGCIIAGVGSAGILAMLGVIWSYVTKINGLQYGGSAGGVGATATAIAAIMIGAIWTAVFVKSVADWMMGTVGAMLVGLFGSAGSMLGGPISGIGRNK